VTDPLPPGHLVANPPNVASNCGGTVTAVAGSTSFSLSGAGLPLGASTCTFAVNIQAPAGIGTVNNTIPAGSVTSTQGISNTVAAVAPLVRANGLNATLNKSFTPPNINSGASSVLLVLISHTNTYTLTNVALTDLMPPGMSVFSLPGPSTSCGAGLVTAVPGANAFSLTGGTVPANGNCTFQVNVTSAVGGNSINTIPTGTMTSAQGVTNGNNPSATLQVLFNLNVSKTFVPVITQTGQTSTLVVTVYNSNASTVAGQATNALLDVFPAGLEIASNVSATTCGGTVLNPLGGTLAAGDTGFRLDGGSFAAASLCTVSVVVRTTPAGATGSYVNTIPIGALNTALGTNPSAAVATMTFLANPTALKTFTPASISISGFSTLSFTLGNPNALTLTPLGLTNAQFTDTLPSGVSIAAPGPASGTCVGAGGNNFSAGQTSLVFSGLTIPAAGTCTVVVQVTAPAAGVFVNAFTGLVSSQTPVPSTVVGSATLTVLSAPTVSKSFSPSFIASGGTGTSVLTIVVNNPNATAMALAAPGVLDIFPTSPGGMVVANLPAASSCVGATIQNSAGGALAAGSTGIRLNNGTVPANGSCTVSVTVFMPLSGTYFNSSAPVTSTNAGSSAAGATAALVISSVAQLVVAKDNGTTAVQAGSTVGYTITFTNNGPADAPGAVVRDAPSAGLSCSSLACTAVGGASCPSLDLPLFLSAGLSLPAFPNGGQVVFSLVCDVTATGL
jgi:uncharacterized repeat protein (TIGR01451 family)